MFRNLDIYGIAEYLSLSVLQVSSWMAALDLELSLTLLFNSKKPLCLSLLNVSNAIDLVRDSILSDNLEISKYFKAVSYGTVSPLTREWLTITKSSRIPILSRIFCVHQIYRFGFRM